jgi:hypothetical protein
MPDKLRDVDFPAAKESEDARAPIGDLGSAETDASERGENFKPRRGEDVRDNVPGRFQAQGNSTWGRDEPGEDAVRQAAAAEGARDAAKRSAGGAEESVPFADTALESRSQAAQASGEPSGAYVDEDSEENRRASRAGQMREGSPGYQARERMKDDE